MTLNKINNTELYFFKSNKKNDLDGIHFYLNYTNWNENNKDIFNFLLLQLYEIINEESFEFEYKHNKYLYFKLVDNIYEKLNILLNFETKFFDTIKNKYILVKLNILEFIKYIIVIDENKNNYDILLEKYKLYKLDERMKIKQIKQHSILSKTIQYPIIYNGNVMKENYFLLLTHNILSEIDIINRGILLFNYNYIKIEYNLINNEIIKKNYNINKENENILNEIKKYDSLYKFISYQEYKEKQIMIKLGLYKSIEDQKKVIQYIYDEYIPLLDFSNISIKLLVFKQNENLNKLYEKYINGYFIICPFYEFYDILYKKKGYSELNFYEFHYILDGANMIINNQSSSISDN